MTASILDAILAQAKAAVTRSYLAAGLLPALTLVLGWQLYEARSVGELRRWIEGPMGKPTSQLPAAALWYVMVVVAIGVGFSVARGFTLRALRDLPGRLLGPIRGALLRRQIDRWWKNRGRNQAVEADLTTLSYLRARLLNEKGPTGFFRPEQEADALARAAAGREAFVKALERPGALGSNAVDAIFRGITAYYGVPVHVRSLEGQHWISALTHPSAEELMGRLYAEAWRRTLASRSAIQEQPLEEWWIAPTSLGNRVAALEDYAMRRYGIATSTLFTRLWGTLGQAERNDIANAQLTLESFANVTAALGLLTLTVAATSMARTIALLRGGSGVDVDWWTLQFVAGGAALCYGAYSAAVFAFESVAENITRLIDLHRVRILTAFGFAPPQTFGEEQAIFRELHDFFTKGTDHVLKRRKLEARTKPAAPAVVPVPAPAPPKTS